jgi:hypothetical protein
MSRLHPQLLLHADKEYAAALIMDKKELNKMFLTLKAIYAAHRENGSPLATEAEFTSYLILVKVMPRIVAVHNAHLRLDPNVFV